MRCPQCGAEMDFNIRQGPRGGYTCPKCGLKIDKKPGKWLKIKY